MIDSYRHRGQRKKLINLLADKGIEDEKVLSAINEVPRHLFIDSAFHHYAYKDEAFPIGVGQTISHPFTVAFQTQLLQVQKNEKVLEVGTGSGYQTAVLVAMNAVVYTIERQKVLFDKSKALLKNINFTPKYSTFGDGFKGLPTFAPYDKILITAAIKETPKVLLDQLKVGGILVAPIGEEDEQVMTTFLKLEDGNCERLEFGKFRFVPMIKSKTKDR